VAPRLVNPNLPAVSAASRTRRLCTPTRTQLCTPARTPTDALRAAHVERARYHADLARRRYLAVDPANRLVADALEADWNTALRALNDAQAAYDRCCPALKMPT